MRQKRIVLAALLFFCLQCIAYAATESFTPPVAGEDAPAGFKLYIEMVNYQTNAKITNSHVTYEIVNKGSGERLTSIKYAEDILELDLPSGSYSIVLKIDVLDTGGNDYFSIGDVQLDRDSMAIFFMYPVGTVRGVVYDKSGSAVEGAKIGFACANQIGDTKDIYSDEYGSFEAGYLPVGTCTMYASKGSYMGRQDIQVREFQLLTQDIILDQSVASSGIFFWIGGMIVLLMAAFFVGSRMRKPKKAKIVMDEKPKEEEHKIASRTSDILVTLKPSERCVVEFLLNNGCESTQAKIRNSTGIPKTSLARIFLYLESKKVLTVEHIGKMKKVKLTDWFLAKE